MAKYFVSFVYESDLGYNGFGYHVIDINTQINGMKEIEEIEKFIKKGAKINNIVILNIQKLPL